MTTSCIDIRASRVGDGITVSASRVSDGISVSASRIGEPMKFRCGLVCSVNDGAYLRVEPDVIWLLPDSADVVVYSNVTWRIE